MEDIEAELLRVTDNQSRDKGRSASNGSDSAADEFDGAIDSDGADDDDPALDKVGDDDDDDDDADDNEFGLDDDDDDDHFSSKQKSRKKPARGSKLKRPSAKSKSKARSKPSQKKSSSRSKGASSSLSDVDDVDDDDQFHYEYDEDGYGDAEDRERLMTMNEIDRELVLAERKDERNEKFFFWKETRELRAQNKSSSNADDTPGRSRRSAATKQATKSVALRALVEDKRKKSKPIDVSDADSEQERTSHRNQKSSELNEEAEVHLLKDDEGPELRYSDLVTSDAHGETVTTPLFLRRETLVRLSQHAYFARVIEGLFVRLKISAADSDGAYIICRIAGVSVTKLYDLVPEKNVKTNLTLLLQSGKQRRSFEIRLTSQSHPTQNEFDVYRERALRGGIEIPRRDEVDRLLKRSLEMIVKLRVTATKEEEEKHMVNMELVYPSRVNWTQKRTEAETGLKFKAQELSNSRRMGDRQQEETLQKEVEELEQRLSTIRDNESRFGMQTTKTGVEVFQSLARRNMELNATNENLAASRRNFESNTATIDPFARFDTTGQSYFSISGKNASASRGDGESGELLATNDIRRYLTSWDNSSKRRRISENPIDEAFGVALPGLDHLVVDFSVKIMPRRSVSLTPPSTDALYRCAEERPTEAPNGAKLVSYEEWSSHRA